MGIQCGIEINVSSITFTFLFLHDFSRSY